MINLIRVLFVFLLLPAIHAGASGISNPYLRPRHNINLNLFGDASIVSVNYEQLFANNRKFFIAGNVGIGYSESSGLPNKNTSLLAIPLHVSANYGEKRHYLEMGLGGTLLFYGNLSYWDYCIYPMIGYRLQPKKKDKFSFRIYAGYPVTDKIDMDNYWFFPVGISVGFCF